MIYPILKDYFPLFRETLGARATSVTLDGAWTIWEDTYGQIVHVAGGKYYTPLALWTTSVFRNSHIIPFLSSPDLQGLPKSVFSFAALPVACHRRPPASHPFSQVVVHLVCVSNYFLGGTVFTTYSIAAPPDSSTSYAP